LSVATKSRGFTKKTEWWGGPKDPLIGFSWKHGSVADTKGILFWSDVFLHEQNGEKIAIVLMDTQGLFELGRDTNLDGKIFGISSLISSNQIFNIKGEIHENHLEYLKVVTDFSKKAFNRQQEKQMSQNLKSFQHLLFLFRDWQDEEVGYGYRGGDRYLKNILEKNYNVSLQ
jgi:atlastin